MYYLSDVCSSLHFINWLCLLMNRHFLFSCHHRRGCGCNGRDSDRVCGGNSSSLYTVSQSKYMHGVFSKVKCLNIGYLDYSFNQ